MEQLAVDTKPLLRPAALADALAEKASLEKKLVTKEIQDKGEVAKQLRRLDTTLRTQTPVAFTGPELDAARRLEVELREQILQGMPSHEEMRKNPPGAVEKHIAWERRNKEKLLQWKNIQLRLNAGNDDGSVANFEKYRPRTSTLNMDSAQISGTSVFLPPPGAAMPVTFSQEMLDLLGSLDKELLGKLALLSNEQRSEVKKVLDKAVSKKET